MLSRIKVFLITGFLGSGKTTLLNNILLQKRKEKSFVIENEFGKQSIDSHLLVKNYNKLFEMNNGCLCCALDNELIEVLQQLIQMENPPENLFIEASGVADTGILASVFRREDVMNYFALQKIVTVVDAENIEDRLDEAVEPARQIVAADVLILNKSDLITSDYLIEVTSMVKAINPFAEVIHCKRGIVNAKLISGVNETTFIQNTYQLTGDPHTKNIRSILIESTEPFDRDKLYANLSITLFLHYHQVYRIKGFVKFEDLPGKYLIQSTGKKLSIEHYGAWEPGESPISKVVFIGVDIQRKGIEKILNRALFKNLHEA